MNRMKNYWAFALTVALLLGVNLGAKAQMFMESQSEPITVTNFRANLFNIRAGESPVYDNNGEACALIRFTVRNNQMKVEGNLGIVKTERLEGEVDVYVPQGTRVLTLRCNGAMLRYEIPVKIEQKITYDATVALSENAARQKNHVVYLAPSYNVTSIAGPALGIGVSINHNNIELSAVYGLNKSDELYFYSTDQTLRSAYTYKAIRAQLRYGYEFLLTNYIRLIPQVGVAANFIQGSQVKSVTTNDKDYMKNASSVSGLLAARFSVGLSESVWVTVTPEYDFGVSKNDNCQTLNDNDDTIKAWTNGFNMNVGLIFYF